MISTSPISPLAMTHLTRHTAGHDLKNGVESDISIIVFGKTYRLHRLILTQSRFFEGMLQGPWKERELNSIEIKFDDKNITEEGFEIAIKKLYDVWTDDRERGEYEDKLEACSVQESNLEIANGLFGGEKGISHEILITVTNVLSVLASGAYLGIDGLSKQCTAFVIQTISANTISKYVQFCHNCDYYPWSDQIAEACHTYLCRNGFDEPKIQCLCVFETLPCQWLLGILKSDAFWVPSEWERYKYCRRIAHNRRRRRGHRNVAIDDEEEQVYDSLFSTCITYMHMSFEQLQVILHDHDPLTGETFTRPEIIHEALWQQIELRATIDYCGEKDGPLDIVTAGYLADSHINEERYWWHDIIPRQDRTFLGDIYSPTQRLVEEGDGSLSDVESALDAPQSSIYPPFRFSVEFENFHLTQNNVRVCSDVVFYGGSYWNVYIQKLPSPDGLKLGVYLHRHSQPKTSRPSKKPLPSLFSSLRRAADKSTGTLQSQEEKGTNVKQKDLYNAEKIQNRLNLVNNQPFKDANENEGFAQTLDLPDIEERSLVPIDESYSCYIDKRDKSKTWFKIFAASIGPTHTVTQFQSRPDDFNVMQSWGWRSSTLCSSSYIPEKTPGSENESETKFQTACPGNVDHQVAYKEGLDQIVQELGLSPNCSQESIPLPNKGIAAHQDQMGLRNGSVYVGYDNHNVRRVNSLENIKDEHDDHSCHCEAKQIFGHNHHHHPALPTTLRISIAMGHV